MAQIGCLGDIVFQVSSDIVKTVNNMQWSGSARYSVHKRHLNNAWTEFTGLEPDKISLDIVLSVYLGVNPMEDIFKIWEYERTGKAVTLVVGEKIYGKNKWTITDHKIKMQNFDKHGNLATVTVSINLLEYLKG